MKFTDKILSIPPYISTSWKNVVSLRVEPHACGYALLIDLASGSRVEILNPDHLVIEEAFATHARVLEEEDKQKNTLTGFFPLPNFEGMVSGTILGHNPDQKDTPALPPFMLEKIALMVKELLPDEISSLKTAEPNCNCPHCQIMRAVGHQDPQVPAIIDEEVSDEDLKFRLWDIQLESDKLYLVTNPEDQQEQYRVFLGDPIGCSCGETKCRHIRAVLET